MDYDRNESSMQATIFKWIRTQSSWPLLSDLAYSITNGAPMRSKRAAGRMVLEGMNTGIPDICIPIPVDSYHGLYMELKSKAGKKGPREEQREKLTLLATLGYRTLLEWSSQDAIRSICSYLLQEGAHWIHPVLARADNVEITSIPGPGLLEHAFGGWVVRPWLLSGMFELRALPPGTAIMTDAGRSYQVGYPTDEDYTLRAWPPE